jgi:hypothetical protein
MFLATINPGLIFFLGTLLLVETPSFYFIVAVFFLPETRGKTLEEIEEFFQSPSRETVA